MRPNIENFIGCDSSYRAASIVQNAATYDTPTSYRPGDRYGPTPIPTPRLRAIPIPATMPWP